MVSESANAPKVFISYSHDSPAHETQVLALADRLRDEGIEAVIDQYVTAPPEGWVRWMRLQIEQADFVLVVPTEIYKRRAEGKEVPGKGLGANREGLIIDQQIYEDSGHNEKFIAVTLAAGQAEFIPNFLKPYQRESVETEDGYEKLYRRLTNRPEVVAPEVGRLRALPARVRLLAPSVESTSANVWHVPPANPFFSGREQYLETLHNSLTTASEPTALTQAIKGLGGMGKTQTALKYAEIYRASYAAGFWTVADSRENLISGFAEFAQLLDLPEKNSQEIVKAANAAKRWFESNDNWLLILDNVDDWAVAQEWIPSGKRGHVIITTRLQSTGRLAHGIDLPKMTPEEGGRFLLERGKIENRSEADSSGAEAISKEFDGLPLGLEQAGAYIEEAKLSPAEYLELYHREGAKLRAKGSATADHQTVTVTFTLAFEKLSDPARQIVHMCAFLAPDAIPEEVLAAGKEMDMEFRDAVSDGVRFSLIQRNPATKSIDIHRLVQDVVKDTMDLASQRTWVERCAGALNERFPEEVKFINWPICERLLPHARIVAAQILRDSLESVSAARLLHQTHWYLSERVEYLEGEPLIRRAIEIRETILGPDHPDTAKSLNDLGVLNERQGRYREAEPLFTRALEIRERVLGQDHSDTATSLSNLGGLYDTQGRYNEAESLFNRALVIREKTLGPDHPETAQVVNNIAALLSSQGRYTEAEPLYKRALEINEKMLGPNHPDTATTLNNVAGLYGSQGQYKEAESLQRRALEIRERVLGPDHPSTATSLNNLAGIYRSLGRPNEAEPLYERALEIREKVLGPTHPDTAGSLNNLAGLYRAQGQYKEAEPLYMRALEIEEQTLGPRHPDTARSLGNLAQLYHNQDRLKEAEPLYKRALEIREEALGPDHPDTASSLNNLGVFYANRGLVLKADPLLRRALAIAEKSLGTKHPTTADIAQRYFKVCQKLGRTHEAHKLRQRFRLA